MSQTTVEKKCKQLKNRTIPVKFRLASKGAIPWYSQTKVFVLFYTEKLPGTVEGLVCRSEGSWSSLPHHDGTCFSSCSNSVKQKAGAIKL